jgi:hypothetical protein
MKDYYEKAIIDTEKELQQVNEAKYKLEAQLIRLKDLHSKEVWAENRSSGRGKMLLKE